MRAIRVSARIAVGILAIAMLGGCATYFWAPNPMGVIRDKLPGGKAKCLVVFLPGSGDRARSYRKSGFIRKLRRRGLSTDIVAADASMGYYLHENVVDRFEKAVMAPARRTGYEQIWLIGVSLGGFGSLLYAKERPGQVAGVLALAPFLGDNPFSKDIREAGGLSKWAAPSPEPLSAMNYEAQLWRWLQAVTSGREPGPRIYLGFGTEDPFADRNELLAAALPAGHVLRAPGGHDWPPWSGIFDRFLEDSDFARACAK
jgi:pimeloyl-ACP methyl ester carboxylesterase